jgi:hypothetical protein
VAVPSFLKELVMSKMNAFKIMLISLAIPILVIITLMCLRESTIFGLILPSMEYKEDMRLTSPDEKVDAVLIQGNAGATESFYYYLYVVPRGSKISEKDIHKSRYKEVFVATKMESQTVAWLKNKTIEIKYNKARIAFFCNHIAPLPEDTRYEVEIRETPPTEPPSLSGTYPGK